MPSIFWKNISKNFRRNKRKWRKKQKVYFYLILKRPRRRLLRQLLPKRSKQKIVFRRGKLLQKQLRIKKIIYIFRNVRGTYKYKYLYRFSQRKKKWKKIKRILRLSRLKYIYFRRLFREKKRKKKNKLLYKISGWFKKKRRSRKYLRYMRVRKRQFFSQTILRFRYQYRFGRFISLVRSRKFNFRKAPIVAQEVKFIKKIKFCLKFKRTQLPRRLVEKRDVFAQNYFLWRFNNLLMRHGTKHHSIRVSINVYLFAKQVVGLDFLTDWCEMHERLRFPFLLKSYYYRGARGVRLVKYVLAREKIERQYVRSLRFLRSAVFRNSNTVNWLKLLNEYEELILAERSPLLFGLNQLTQHAIDARGDRLDDKYHRALERLENNPDLHFRW